MEKAKDGVTLIADAIRAEMKKAEEEKAKQQATPPANVIDVTAQFKATPPATPANADKGNEPPTPPANADKGNEPPANDGTIYENDK